MYKRARDWKPTISVETCNSIPQISPENWELDNLMRKHNGRGKGRRRRGGGKGNRNGILDMTKETVVGGGGWEYVDLKRKHSDKKWEGGREGEIQSRWKFWYWSSGRVLRTCWFKGKTSKGVTNAQAIYGQRYPCLASVVWETNLSHNGIEGNKVLKNTSCLFRIGVSEARILVSEARTWVSGG